MHWHWYYHVVGAWCLVLIYLPVLTQASGRSIVCALATMPDSVASNNNLSMMSEVKVSATLAKAVAKDASAVPVDVALKMATINGARAYNLDKEIGSLVPGKSADFIAISVASIENFPVFNAVTHLIYSVDRSQYVPQRKDDDAWPSANNIGVGGLLSHVARVTDVWVAGKRLLNSHHLTTIDEVRAAADSSGLR